MSLSRLIQLAALAGAIVFGVIWFAKNAEFLRAIFNALGEM